ncbi:MAG: cyclic beta,2-glucan synthetase [Acidobacteriaceae bacterium]|jgi:cyclic beta-1,2-glucan synthetase
MQQNRIFEMIEAEADNPMSAPDTPSELEDLRSRASRLSRELVSLPDVKTSRSLPERGARLCDAFKPIFQSISSIDKDEASDDLRWLRDNVGLLSSDLEDSTVAVKTLQKLPHVKSASGPGLPRVAAVADSFLNASGFRFSDETFSAYIEAFQRHAVLTLKELWALVPVLKLLLLEEIAKRSKLALAKRNETFDLGTCIRSLREAGQAPWKSLIEPLIIFDRALRQDPAGAYPRMDFESRDLYRNQIVKIAEFSDFTEVQVAEQVLSLARAAQNRGDTDPRRTFRRSHVGYYLIAEGADALHQRVGFRMPLGYRIESVLRKHPDDFYLPGIEILTLVIMSAMVWLSLDTHNSLLMVLFSIVVLLLPSSQSAVELVNYLITSLLPARILPKLELQEIPSDCVTVVAVPTLLMNEKQVRRLIDDLEVRYLGNHDANIHFALVSDLPDSREAGNEDDPLVTLCAQLIEGLNKKHGDKEGSFFLFHRHRVYNPREGVWMGWERKRGKLLDLNKLLRGENDHFPVKTGNLSLLPNIRFVITLDSDTELPRGSAHRMIGTLAHPLNQAIIDPERNVVVAGYGILQPRVGVSVQSAVRSRLASIYSGETGFDIYTRAVSDVYQDLYGEGIFAGKGIYEVGTLHRVLERRFPRNYLLSHDLIEGAYARAGLVSDIEIIEDYPSHYSAYNRRKHRWLRGDWQITGWLSSHVPDESGKSVRNPISLVAQWKIFDNLRRSLVEPATFVLLVLGWLVLPGTPRYWTIATLVILFVPAYFRFAFELTRAVIEREWEIASDAASALFTANINIFLTLTFLAHQTLVSLDAVVRTMIRRSFTRRRLLEWETAAQAESGVRKRTSLDIYLNWMPAIAIALGLIVWLQHRPTYAWAFPVLLLWASSKLVSDWLNLPPRPVRTQTSEKDDLFLRRAALRTWRYFAEFSTEEHHWLIPDNVQETPPVIAARVSPTNIGFLLNTRQVACEFGYLTAPEFTQQTLNTLATIAKLSKYRGHLYNWYNTKTLSPLPPAFISSVDSGNLVASLWTLEQGCLQQLTCPLFKDSLAEGLLDCLRVLGDRRALSRNILSGLEKEIKGKGWIKHLLNLPAAALDVNSKAGASKHGEDVSWFAEQATLRLASVRHMVKTYSPWLLPEFDSLRDDPSIGLKPAWECSPLRDLPNFIDLLTLRLQQALASEHITAEQKLLHQNLLALLPETRANVLRLIDEFRSAATQAGELADSMDFSFLLNRRRKLLSIGFDGDSQQLNASCYDLLASEARIAVFAAIAKEDIPQESWFLLGRLHTLEKGSPVLVSWTGTMFEYLMPTLWMRTYANTLLERSRAAAVEAQKDYTATRRIPWGISESAYAKTDEAGNYQYHAFGLPRLSLKKPDFKALVISPYSTFLALDVDPSEALRNLRDMADKGWFGTYGFYESADFSPSSRRSWRKRYELVCCWMAHHQGMTLLSIANFLHEGVVQRWFHADPRVQATELLLHEKPVAHVLRSNTGYGSSAD